MGGISERKVINTVEEGIPGKGEQQRIYYKEEGRGEYKKMIKRIVIVKVVFVFSQPAP